MNGSLTYDPDLIEYIAGGRGKVLNWGIGAGKGNFPDPSKDDNNNNGGGWIWAVAILGLILLAK